MSFIFERTLTNIYSPQRLQNFSTNLLILLIEMKMKILIDLSSLLPPPGVFKISIEKWMQKNGHNF